MSNKDDGNGGYVLGALVVGGIAAVGLYLAYRASAKPTPEPEPTPTDNDTVWQVAYTFPSGATVLSCKALNTQTGLRECWPVGSTRTAPSPPPIPSQSFSPYNPQSFQGV